MASYGMILVHMPNFMTTGSGIQIILYYIYCLHYFRGCSVGIIDGGDL
jgi:hypothetical protein